MSRCAATALPAPPRSPASIEELLRTILRRGVTGEIGTDFRAAADEALLADGLAIGEGSPDELGTDTEWELDAIEIEDMAGAEPEAETIGSELDLGFDSDDEEIVAARIQPDPEPEAMPDLDYAPRPAAAAEPTSRERKQIHLPLIVPDGEEETVAEAEEEESFRPARSPSSTRRSSRSGSAEPSRTASGGGWLDEVDDGATMDFPARPNHLRELSRSPMDREEVKARVDYLFPRTETNWTVGRNAPRRATG